jgi:hypothetical protein
MTTNRWELFVLCSLGWPLAWLFYRGAIQSAFSYSLQVKVTFDLYRHLLLEALKRPVPSTLEEERKAWKRLSEFFMLGRPLPPVPIPPDPAWSRVATALAAYLEQMNANLPDRVQQGKP